MLNAKSELKQKRGLQKEFEESGCPGMWNPTWDLPEMSVYDIMKAIQAKEHLLLKHQAACEEISDQEGIFLDMISTWS